MRRRAARQVWHGEHVSEKPVMVDVSDTIN